MNSESNAKHYFEIITSCNKSCLCECSYEHNDLSKCPKLCIHYVDFFSIRHRLIENMENKIYTQKDIIIEIASFLTLDIESLNTY